MKRIKARPAVLAAICISLLLLAQRRLAGGAGEPGGTCSQCHASLAGKLQAAVTQWRESVHLTAGVGCSDCHGGDPTASDMAVAMSRAAGFIGVPDRASIPRLCARCHSNPVRMRPFNLPTSQYDQYLTSIHGKRLAQGDPRVATCASCHGAHKVLRGSDVQSPVYPVNVARTCARCHSDKKLMQPYGIPTDQYGDYVRSVHGRKLVIERVLIAPSCANCHSAHGAAPPGVADVAEVCGRCHSPVAAEFAKGPHQKALQKLGIPRCVDCHGNHAVLMPSDAMLVGDQPGDCGSCHRAESAEYAIAGQLHNALAGAQQRYDRVNIELARVASLHEEVGEGREEMADAFTSLKEARVASHEVSPAAVRTRIEGAIAAIDRAMDVAREGAKRSYWRRVNVAIAALILLGISGLLYIKWSALRLRWLRRIRRE